MSELEKNTEEVSEETGSAPAVTEAKKPKKSEKKAKKSDKKPNAFVRFFRWIAKGGRDYRSEAKKISWKSWKEVCKSAGLVIVVVLIFSVIILGLDLVFGSLFEWLAKLI